jgi:hypothetical protein
MFKHHPETFLLDKENDICIAQLCNSKAAYVKLVNLYFYLYPYLQSDGLTGRNLTLKTSTAFSSLLLYDIATYNTTVYFLNAWAAEYEQQNSVRSRVNALQRIPKISILSWHHL